MATLHFKPHGRSCSDGRAIGAPNFWVEHVIIASSGLKEHATELQQGQQLAAAVACRTRAVVRGYRAVMLHVVQTL